MNIGGTNGVNGPQRIFPKGPRGPQEQSAGAAQPVQGDRVEISDAARLQDAISRLPDIRSDLVAAAKEMIANGTLDTPANMDLAMNRLMDDLLSA